MNIVEATKKAMEQGKGITNQEALKLNRGLYYLPTNTETCYIIIPIGYKPWDKETPAIRWNPRAADILRDDWELY